MQHQLLQTECSKAKFANMTTLLMQPLDDGPIGGQVSRVPLYLILSEFNYPVSQIFPVSSDWFRPSGVRQSCAYCLVAILCEHAFPKLL